MAAIQAATGETVKGETPPLRQSRRWRLTGVFLLVVAVAAAVAVHLLGAALAVVVLAVAVALLLAAAVLRHLPRLRHHLFGGPRMRSRPRRVRIRDRKWRSSSSRSARPGRLGGRAGGLGRRSGGRSAGRAARRLSRAPGRAAARLARSRPARAARSAGARLRSRAARGSFGRRAGRGSPGGRAGRFSRGRRGGGPAGAGARSRRGRLARAVRAARAAPVRAARSARRTPARAGRAIRRAPVRAARGAGKVARGAGVRGRKVVGRAARGAWRRSGGPRLARATGRTARASGRRVRRWRLTRLAGAGARRVARARAARAVGRGARRAGARVPVARWARKRWGAWRAARKAKRIPRVHPDELARMQQAMARPPQSPSLAPAALFQPPAPQPGPRLDPDEVLSRNAQPAQPRTGAVMSSSGVAAVDEAIAQHVGGFTPQHMVEQDRFLHDLPHMFINAGQSFKTLAERLRGEHPVDGVVCEHMAEASAQFAGLHGYFEELYQTWRTAHRDELKRLEEPRAGEPEWDVTTAP